MSILVSGRRHEVAGRVQRGKAIASIPLTQQGLSTADLRSSLRPFFSALTSQHESVSSPANPEQNGVIYRSIEDLYPELPPLPSFVSEEVSRIRGGASFLLLAHQPVLFPYEAVVLNYTLLHSIAELIQPNPPCIIHLVMDTDGADERAFHRIKYPAASMRQGFTTLRADVGAHWTGWTCNALCAPRQDTLIKTLDDIAAVTRQEWRMADGRRFNARSIEPLRDTFHAANLRGPLLTTFMINIMADYAWSYLRIPVIFMRYSAILQYSGNAIAGLVENRHQYHAALSSAVDDAELGRKLVPESPDDLFWRHCSHCWTRSSFSGDGHVEHHCLYHPQSHGYGGPASHPAQLSIVPKVLLEDIFLRTCISPLGIVSYRGGYGHTAVSAGALKALGRQQPETLTWGSGWLSDGPIEALHARDRAAPGAQRALELIHSGRASMLYAWMHASADAKRLHLQSLIKSALPEQTVLSRSQEREAAE